MESAWSRLCSRFLVKKFRKYLRKTLKKLGTLLRNWKRADVYDKGENSNNAESKRKGENGK